MTTKPRMKMEGILPSPSRGGLSPLRLTVTLLTDLFPSTAVIILQSTFTLYSGAACSEASPWLQWPCHPGDLMSPWWSFTGGTHHLDVHSNQSMAIFYSELTHSLIWVPASFPGDSVAHYWPGWGPGHSDPPGSNSLPPGLQVQGYAPSILHRCWGSKFRSSWVHSSHPLNHLPSQHFLPFYFLFWDTVSCRPS